MGFLCTPLARTLARRFLGLRMLAIAALLSRSAPLGFNTTLFFQGFNQFLSQIICYYHKCLRSLNREQSQSGGSNGGDADALRYGQDAFRPGVRSVLEGFVPEQEADARQRVGKVNRPKYSARRARGMLQMESRSSCRCLILLVAGFPQPSLYPTW